MRSIEKWPAGWPGNVVHYFPRMGGVGPCCRVCDRGGEITAPYWPIVPVTEGYRFGEICYWCDRASAIRALCVASGVAS